MRPMVEEKRRQAEEKRKKEGMFKKTTLVDAFSGQNVATLYTPVDADLMRENANLKCEAERLEWEAMHLERMAREYPQLWI